jgi:hypothetical protein
MTRLRTFVILLAVSTAAVMVAGPASAASPGAPVRGTLSGNGTQFVGGDALPLLISVSDGTLKASLLGPATYRPHGRA